MHLENKQTKQTTPRNKHLLTNKRMDRSAWVRKVKRKKKNPVWWHSQEAGRVTFPFRPVSKVREDVESTLPPFPPSSIHIRQPLSLVLPLSLSFLLHPPWFIPIPPMLHALSLILSPRSILIHPSSRIFPDPPQSFLRPPCWILLSPILSPLLLPLPSPVPERGNTEHMIKDSSLHYLHWALLTSWTWLIILFSLLSNALLCDLHFHKGHLRKAANCMLIPLFFVVI